MPEDRPSLQARALSALLRLPSAVQRRLPIGVPAVVAGRELAPAWQTLLFLRSKRRLPSPAELTPEVSRALFRAISFSMGGPPEPLAEVRDGAAPGGAGGVPIRLYVPEGAREGGALVVYFHGGGFVDGSLATHDGLCRALAAGSQVRVLSVGYRLAPEHPFPAGLDDARAVFSWAVAGAESLGADPERVAIGGDSSGGNFAAVIAQEGARGDGPRPAALFLLYPLLDMSERSRSFELFGQGYGLESKLYDWYMDRYLPDRGRRSDLRASPLLAGELKGHPRALIATAGFDILHDEGEAYARRLSEAGVEVDYRCYDDMLHGFARCLWVMPAARAAIDDVARRLGALTGGQ